MKTRIISSIVMGIIAIGAMAITYFIPGIAGHITGIVLYSLLGMVGIYEVLKSFSVSKMTAAIMTLVVPMVMMFPYANGMKMLIEVDNYPAMQFFDAVDLAIGSWEPWVIVAVFAFLTLAAETHLWKQWKKSLLIYIFMIMAPIFFKSLWAINVYSFGFVFYFIGISIVSDSMAYFGGMAFGKKWFKGAKLAPTISPKKTWAGFVIGTAFAILAAVLGGYYGGIFSDFGKYELLVAILVGIFLSLISPMGDLLFSYFKRTSGTKDFSNLIPGHGGIFDRLDAMCVVTFFGSLIMLFAALV